MSSQPGAPADPSLVGVAIDLTSCDREPIHLLGAVQPFGCLLALSPDWIVRHCSQNVGTFLDRPPEAVIGHGLGAIVDRAAEHVLRSRFQAAASSDSVERVFGLDLVGDGRLFDVAVHLGRGFIIIEFEPNERQGDLDAASLVRTMVGRLQRLTTQQSLFHEATRQMRALTEFDRVMIYRFDHDGSGEVVSEVVRPGLESFLGLHYPASDIPRQARILYERNWLRIIPDISATPSPITPWLTTEQVPVDLSMSVLRSVSPIHIEYLTNMGVGASLSVSILRQGRLWGLFACHHYGPRRISFERRTAAELFGQMFSLILESREREAEIATEVRSRHFHNRLLAGMATDRSPFENIVGFLDEIAELLGADGIGVTIDGRNTLRGVTPTQEEFGGLIRYLRRRDDDQVHAVSELGQVHAPARHYAERAAGLLSIPLSHAPGNFLVVFRREIARTVSWAGDPTKPMGVGPMGARLNPRSSFALWQEQVRGQATPWSAGDLRIAESLRISLLEVILRLTDAADRQRRAAEERQELLIAELNHRVRNILALIRGLIAQSRSGVRTTEEFASVLGGRIQALALAHDQITADNWAPAPLRELVLAEAGAYLGDKAGRVSIEGPDILLEPQALSILALVMHELITNSAKYGALSDSRGRVAIRVAIDGRNQLEVHWRESGGPAVQAPTRRGFGSTIIEHSIPHDLGGESAIRFEMDGVKARFVIPAVYVRVAPQGVARPASVQPELLEGEGLDGSVLLVEDNLIIALDGEDMLLGLGAARVETAASVGDALAVIARQPPDIAVLDVNLGRETSFEVAEKLRTLGIPLVFATGYGEALSLPPEFEGVTILKKPYTAEHLRSALIRARATGGPRIR
ncbi:HWE histidine kinase domain-containing protein [Zavarzinia sp. CC-PAN008]|uniref:HWE histidine kinase domain-containing protein n=1 Tax=Zavarzinia sp. CC-PAN008 TaxID=3243332 RepID=UPI003F742C72